MLVEMSRKYRGDATKIGSWKRAVIESMATAFTRRGATPEHMDAAYVNKLHPMIGQFVVEREFLAEALHQLLGTGSKNGEQRSSAERLPPVRSFHADMVHSV